MTGLDAWGHGADADTMQIDTALPTLTELLADNGYSCGMATYNPSISAGGGVGIERGFHEVAWLGTTIESTVQALRRQSGKPVRYDPMVQIQQVHALLDAHDQNNGRVGAPRFLFVDWMDAHHPFFDVDAEGQLRRMRWPEPADHLAQVVPLNSDEFALMRHDYDAVAGRMLDRLALLADQIAASGRPTRLIVTADHGEALGEHGLFGHVYEVTPELIRVPMVVVDFPGADASRVPARVAAPVQANVWGPDIFDTVLEWASIPIPRHTLRRRYVEGADLDALRSGVGPATRVFPIPFAKPSDRLAHVREQAKKGRDPVAVNRWCDEMEADSVSLLINGRLCVWHDGKPRWRYPSSALGTPQSDRAPLEPDQDESAAYDNYRAWCAANPRTMPTERSNSVDDPIFREQLEALGYAGPPRSPAPLTSGSPPATMSPERSP
jgi:hypothetical protein